MSLANQAMWLKALCGFTPVVEGKLLKARGKVRPHPLTDEYTLEVHYKMGKRPRVFVLDPPIEYRNHERAEHMYSDNEPCVFLPRSGEWTRSKLLAETLVPWTMLWLIFYETWLVTGKWDGGGVHPTSRRHAA